MKLEEAQKVLYDILCVIDDICTKYDIQYSLDGGSMLGAVRHQGFIPWDDDIDIIINRKDYRKLYDALKSDLPSYYKVIDPKDYSPYFFDFVPRVVDTRYCWHTPTDEDEKYNNLQNYLCVDIFCQSYTPKSNLATKMLILKHKILYGMAMQYRVKKDLGKYSFMDKAKVCVLNFIGKFFSLDKIYDMQAKLSDKYINKKSDKTIVVNTIMQNFDIVYDSESFSDTVRVKFGDRDIPIYKGYHSILTLEYGADYMTPKRDTDKYKVHLDVQ